MFLDAVYPYLLPTPETAGEHAYLLRLPCLVHLPQGRLGAIWTRLPWFTELPIRFVDAAAAARVQAIGEWLKIDPTLRYLQGADFAEERAVFSADYEPRDYQLRGVRHLRTVRRVLLADAMGLGKTVQAGGAVLVDWYAAAREGRSTAGKFVVVCPSGLRRQWRRELVAAFVAPGGDTPAFKSESILVHDGAPPARKLGLRMLQEPGSLVFVVSYELLLRDRVEIMDTLRQVGVRAVVCDEAGRIKNPHSASFGAVSALSEAHPDALFFLLNGTPIENAAEDLWAQLAVVRPALYPSPTEFADRYVRSMTIRARGREFQKIIGYQRLEEMRALTRDVLVRRSYADVDEELPAVVTSERVVELTPAQRAEHDRISADKTLSADHKMSELVRTALYVTTVDGKFHSSKCDELLAALGECEPGEQVVVCAVSKIFIRELERRVRAAEILVERIDGDTPDQRRMELVSAFTAGSFRVLLGTGAIERGLNLQCAGVLMQADLPWNPGVWLQRVGRVRRLGSRHASARVVQIIADNSVETHVRKVVYRKQGLFTGAIGELDVVPVVDPAQLVQGLERRRKVENASA